MKFAVIGDAHIGWSPREEVNLRRVVNIINGLDVDFTIQLGDVTEAGQSHEDQFVLARHLLDQLKQPYYTVRGNHDYGSNYNKYFGEAQYFFEADPFSFVFLDLKPSGETPPWTAFNWAQLNPSNLIVVSIHTTPHPSGTWADSYQVGLLEKLESLNRVALVLSGDFHTWKKYTLNDIQYWIVDGTGGGGGVYPTPEQGSKTDGYFGLCETRDNQISLTKISFQPSLARVAVPLLLGCTLLIASKRVGRLLEQTYHFFR